MLSTMDEGDNLTTYVVSDKLSPAKGTLMIEAYTYDGTPLSSTKRKMVLSEGEVKKFSLPKSQIFGEADPAGIFVHSTFDIEEYCYEKIFLPS